MTTFFKPYEGTRPFLFISYAHRQSDTVVAAIRVLHDKGWRLWYDEGIPAGSDWPANIARHMEDCERVIFFLSERALSSPNCFSEMKTAARLGKPMLIVYLEDAEINGEWKELMAGQPMIPMQPGPDAYAAAILRSGFLSRRFHRKWIESVPRQALGLAASLLFFLGAVFFAGRWIREQQTRVPVAPEVPVTAPPTLPPDPTPKPTVDVGEAAKYFDVRFPDRQQERAVRRALGTKEEKIFRWDLAQIKSLYFVGSMTPDSLDAVTRDADGTLRVNGAPVIEGSVSDLSRMSDMVCLERLALVNQPVKDLSPLNGLVLLEELDLSDSAVESLEGLKDLPSLETLHLEHTRISDLTPLSALTHLKTVTVSRDMLPLTWKEDSDFSVILSPEP